MNLAQLQDRIGGPRAISWASFVVLAPLATLSNLFRLGTLHLPVGDRALFILFGACVAAALIGCLWTAFKLRPRNAILPLWLVLGTYAGIGIVRALIPTFGAQVGLLPPQTISPIDVIQAVIACIILFGLVALVMDSLDRQQQAISDLERRSEELDQLRRGAAARLRGTKADLEQRIDSEIAPMLDQFVSSLTTVAEAGAPPEQLRSSAELMRKGPRDAVRSLGHDLSRTHAEPAETIQPSTSKKLRLSSVIRTMTSGDPFAPTVSAVLVFIAFLGASINATNAGQGLVIAVAMAVVNFLVLTVVRRSYPRVKHSRSRTLAWILAVLVTGILSGTPYLFLSATTDLPSLAGVIVVMVVLWFSALIALAKSAAAQLQQTTRALHTTNESYQAQAAGLDEATTALKRRVGTVLHGELQGRIVANALRLDLAARSDQPQARIDAVDQVINELTDIQSQLAHLTTIEITSETLRANLQTICDRWHGVVDIHVAPITDELEELLADECASITEIVREGINNAAKHGAATEAWVNLSAPDHERIEIVIRDNGTGPVAVDQRPEIRTAWDIQATTALTRQRGLTELHVTLPLASRLEPAQGP